MIVKQKEMYISNKDLADFNARLLSYTVGGTEYSQTYNNATTNTGIFPILFSSDYGLREISITVVFKPDKKYFSFKDTLHNLIINKNKLDTALLSDEVELFLPDGFYYRVILTKAGNEKIEGQELEATYNFVGVRHEEKVALKLSFGDSTTHTFTVKGNTKTGAKISFTTVNANKFDIYLNDSIYNFSNIVLENIILDGINKEIKSNTNVEFINFPTLKPDANTLASSVKAFNDITVEYYPIWV